MATAVLGLQWGDEGKGKITHWLARSASMVVRFNGGPNAGHTVIDRGVKFGTHLLPAGVFYTGVTSVLAAGVVVDLEVLRREHDEVARHIGGKPRLLLAENAHLILPYHRTLEELEGSGARFGTTRRGISPAYRDKAAHVGVRVGDLLDPRRMEERIAWRLDLLRKEWPLCAELKALHAREVVERQVELASPWMESIVDASEIVERAVTAGEPVLFEGAQGTLLDLDFGTYPYVTSSSTLAAGIGTSLGIDVGSVSRRIGVAKAYQTRVGEGPFPTELDDDTGEALRERGGEFGTTTGRPRRCGWLDLVSLRYAVRLNGITELALTKLDVLGDLKALKLCRVYRLGHTETDRFPLSGDKLGACRPIYDELPGWRGDLRPGTWEELPESLRRYVGSIEEAAGVPVTILSYGAKPEETLQREL